MKPVARVAALVKRMLHSPAHPERTMKAAPVPGLSAAPLEADEAWRLLKSEAWDAAEALFRDRLAAGSSAAMDYYGLGQIHMFRGRFSDAAVIIARAHALQPDSVEIASDLGSLQWLRGWYEAARDVLREAAPRSANADTWHYLGMALLCLEEPGAATALREALKRNPTIADRFWAQELYGQVLAYLDLPEAPRDRASDLRRAEAMARVGRLVGAERMIAALAPFGPGEERVGDVAALLRFLRGHPVDKVPVEAQAFVLQTVDLWRLLTEERWIDVPYITGLLLGIVKGEQPAYSILPAIAARFAIAGLHDRAIECYRAYASRSKPGDRNAMGWLGSLLAGESTTRANVLDRVREANRFLFPGSDRPNRFPPPRPLGSRRIRVGYNCGYFGHGTSQAVYGALFAAHDRSAFEIVGFNTAPADAETRRVYEPLVDRWVECGHMDAGEIERTIIGAELDILNDLDGVGSFMGPILARKLAPVQVNMMNWALTTGMPAFDYCIVYEGVIEPADEPSMSERIKVTPQLTAWRTQEAPPIVPPPALERGYVTFGCFGAGHKVTQKSLDLWAAILREVPGSRMRLKSPFAASHEGRDFYRRQFLNRGVSPDRLILDAFTEYATALRAYDEIDISLDTFPHSGGGSAWGPLWQGVPLVTLNRDRFCSRWGTNYVAIFGHPEWSARSEEDYIAIAIDLASDVGRLATWRAQLRQNVAIPSRPWGEVALGLEQIYREIVAGAVVAGR